jgi:predicted RNA binding protein YcfA (HicA-like mRNA interferase family)
MKVRDAIRLIEQDGWYQVDMRGSHWQFKHPRKNPSPASRRMTLRRAH